VSTFAEQVFFKTPEEADLAISMLDGRLFSKSCGAMKCYTWDGRTKYKIAESAEEEKARCLAYQKFFFYIYFTQVHNKKGTMLRCRSSIFRR
jgi:hypothetical protein